jgi:hypothetical protein
MRLERNRTYVECREITTLQASSTSQTKGLLTMNTRRPAIVRIAASTLLAATVTLGAHGFVPSAFAGQGAGADCKASETTSTMTTVLQGLRYVIDVVGVVIP